MPFFEFELGTKVLKLGLRSPLSLGDLVELYETCPSWTDSNLVASQNLKIKVKKMIKKKKRKLKNKKMILYEFKPHA